MYAGSLYANRYKTLVKLANEIEKINRTRKYFQLDIYTQSDIDKKAKEILNDGQNSFVHQPVDSDLLKKIYLESDIALHVEAFDIKSRRQVRLSFSTKIVECLDSGCAVMAICDSQQAGFAYLKRNDAAICISNPSEINTILNKILSNQSILIDYQEKAFILGKKNHLEVDNKRKIQEDFYALL